METETVGSSVQPDANFVKRRVIVNGVAAETHAATLEELLAELGYEGQIVATAVDGAFVPSALRLETAIVQDMRVEVVAPRQGG